MTSTVQFPTTPACVCCGRPLHGHTARTACHPCERRITERLTGIADYYTELPDHLAPGRSGGNTIRALPGSRLPLNLSVINLLGPGGIADMLGKQEDAWRQALDWEPRKWRGNAAQTLPAVLAFLGNNLLWACTSYDYVDALDRELAQLYSESKAIITGERRRIVRVGCLAVYDDGSMCGEEMRIDVWAPSAKCGSCGARYTREEWMSLYEQATQALAA